MWKDPKTRTKIAGLTNILPSEEQALVRWTLRHGFRTAALNHIHRRWVHHLGDVRCADFHGGQLMADHQKLEMFPLAPPMKQPTGKADL